MVSSQNETRQIIVVEDDADTAEMIASLLGQAGYDTIALHSGSLALDVVLADPPDLILLDLDLPDTHGIHVLQTVREHSFLPMIVISGHTQQKEKVHALEAGADDFLAKPFAPDELLARVKALLRRVDWTPNPKTCLRVRKLELDLPRRHVLIRGKRLHLTPIEYGLLVTLMRNAGATVSHDELLLAVWGKNYKGDYSVLRVNISRLRQKLEENPRNPQYIITVAGQGYTMPTD